jgi:hypothetical protein
VSDPSRALGRYRFMFRCSLGMITFGVLLLVLCMAAWAVGPMPRLLPTSLLAIGLGVLCAYRFVISTARILYAHEAHDRP